MIYYYKFFLFNLYILMSLINKCIQELNNFSKRLRNIHISKEIFNKFEEISVEDQLNFINKILYRYYEPGTMLIPKITKTNQEIQLPEIITTPKEDNCAYITIYNIHPEINENKQMDEKIFKSMNTIKETVNKYDNLFIDFANCSGGNLDILIDAFSPIIGSGLMFKYEGPKTKGYCYYINNKITYSKSKLNIKREKPKCCKNIVINVGKKSLSTGEFIPILIKNAYPNTKIIGTNKETGGMLSIRNNLYFNYDEKEYIITTTIAPIIYDSNGTKYNRFIKLHKKI